MDVWRSARFMTVLCCAAAGPLRAQTLGGNAVFNFLQTPSSTTISALGGANVSAVAEEVSHAVYNPALLTPELHAQANFLFSSLPGGIKSFSGTTAFDAPKWATTFAGQIRFIDYGTIAQTDAAGNTYGNFHPTDFVVQLSAARNYLDRWRYGVNLKFIESNYQLYTSSGIALDLGIHYADSSNGIFAGALVTNLGGQLKTYDGTAESLPFDLQVGITKKLLQAPLGFSITAWHVNRFNILYNDTVLNASNGWTTSASFASKLFDHVLLAMHIYVNKTLEGDIGYNHLRRTELNIGTAGNGLNGFSAGLRAKFSKMQVMYAVSAYQRNIVYHQLGITLHMNRLLTRLE
jgi:hypothetical protein